MSSAKRPYNETTLNDNNDYVEEEQQVEEQDMDVENDYQEEEDFINTRRRRLNTDKDDDLEDRFKSSAFISNPFPSTLNNHSSSSTSSTRNSFNNYSSLRSTTS